MPSINIIDPNTGQAHSIPYDELPHALEAGGQFADEDQKKKAIGIQDGTYSENESSIAETPFNPSKPMELELTKGQDNQETMGWKGVKEDAINMLRNSLKNGVGLARRAPGEAKELASELGKHPLSSPPHIAQQVLASLGEGAKDILNIPHEALKELGEKNIIPDWLKKYNELPFTHIPEDTGAEKLLGLEPTKKSDELLRELPTLYGGGKLVGQGLSKVKKFAAAPSKEKLFQRELEDRISKIAEKKSISEADLKALQNQLKLDYSNIHSGELGELSDVGQKVQINRKKLKLESNPKKGEIPEGELPKVPEGPDTKSMLEEHQELIDKAKSEAEKTVGIKENPSLKAGETVKKSIEDLEKSSSDIYNSARDHYIDKKITADNSGEIKAATDELEALKDADELAPGYGSGTPEQKSLQENIDALKGEKVKASDVFSLMRTSQQLANKFRMKRKGATQLEWERLTKIANNLDNHAEKLGKRLEEVGGQDVRAMIKQANKGYRTFKQLSKDNPVGKAAMKGNVPNNALIKLAEDHPANEFLNGLVDSDAELRKNLLAAYAGENNVNRLTKPSSLTKKYIESLPEIEDKINAFKNAVSEYSGKEKQARKIDKDHDDLVKSMKEVAEAKKLDQEIKFHEEALPKIEAKMKQLEADTAEHKKLQKELDAHKKFIQDKGGRLKELSHFFVKVKLAGKLHL